MLNNTVMMNKQEILNNKLKILQAVAQASDPVTKLQELQAQHPELLDPLLVQEAGQKENTQDAENKSRVNIKQLKNKLKTVWDVH